MKIKSLINWKLFLLLLGSGVLATLAIFPFLLTVQGEALNQVPLPLVAILALSLFQTAVLLGIAIFFGLFLSKKVNLGAPILENLLVNLPIKERLKSVVGLSVKLGAMVGVLIIGFDYIFIQFMEPISFVQAPLWQGFLGSFYGGIVEEILLRLFLVTLLVWIMWRFSKSRDGKPSSVTVSIAIVAAAIIFGLGHLPATAVLTTITPLIIFRAVILNGIGGVVFGWLYWKRGLESAMIAHFTADIVLLVILPLVLSLG